MTEMEKAVAALDAAAARVVELQRRSLTTLRDAGFVLTGATDPVAVALWREINAGSAEPQACAEGPR